MTGSKTGVIECAREGCHEPAKVKFCSRECANKRGEPKQGSEIAVMTPRIIDGVYNMAARIVGEDKARQLAAAIERDQGFMLRELPTWISKHPLLDSVGLPGAQSPSLVMKPQDMGETGVQPYAAIRSRFNSKYMAELRTDDALPIEDIDRMQQSGPVVMASRVKMGPIVSALTSERKWKLVCNAGLKPSGVINANLRYVFKRYVLDFLEAMHYGYAAGAVKWKRMSADRIGVDIKGVGAGSKWWVIDQIHWAHPSTIEEILRDPTDDWSFAGFIHRRTRAKKQYKTISPLQALLLTYQGRYQRLTGRSMHEPIYDFWFWYEVILRFLLRYMERMATPVVYVKAPEGRITRPDGKKVNALEYALLVASMAAHHNALAIPSSLDPQKGVPMWDIGYLETKGSPIFVEILDYLSTQIMRGEVVGDRAATQSGEMGSYNAAIVHAAMTEIDSDTIFQSFLWQIQEYLVQRYSKFNIDFNQPPRLWLASEVMDPLEREVLMKLFATAGNVKIGDGSPMDRINWEEAFRNIYVPLLTDEEMEAQREKRLEEKKENMRLLTPKPSPFQQVQPQSQGQGQPQPTQQSPKQQEREPPAKDVKARVEILEHVVGGGKVPAIMTLDDARRLESEGFLTVIEE